LLGISGYQAFFGTVTYFAGDFRLSGIFSQRLPILYSSRLFIALLLPAHDGVMLQPGCHMGDVQFLQQESPHLQCRQEFLFIRDFGI